jgi:hypothetical protein
MSAVMSPLPVMSTSFRFVVLNLSALGAVTTASVGAEPVRFNEQIRPLLSDRCFACHGPDAKRREADLRLDVRADAVGDGDGPRGIVPGKPQASAVWERITSTDPELQMPPASAKKPKFTPAELALIRRWIEEGAEYEGHWAFLPLKEPRPPEVKLLSGNPIDALSETSWPPWESRRRHPRTPQRCCAGWHWI